MERTFADEQRTAARSRTAEIRVVFNSDRFSTEADIRQNRANDRSADQVDIGFCPFADAATLRGCGRLTAAAQRVSPKGTFNSLKVARTETARSLQPGPIFEARDEKDLEFFTFVDVSSGCMCDLDCDVVQSMSLAPQLQSGFDVFA